MLKNYKINFIVDNNKQSIVSKRRSLWFSLFVTVLILCFLNLAIAFGTNDFVNKINITDPSDASSVSKVKNTSRPTIGDIVNSVENEALNFLMGSSFAGTSLSGSSVSDGFNIYWYSMDTGTYAPSLSTPVHYVEDNDEAFSDDWASLREPFWSDDVQLEYCPNKAWMTDGNSRGIYQPFAPCFDITNYEETYEIDGDSYAYSKGFLKINYNNTNIGYQEVTKFAYNHNEGKIYYIDEMASDCWTNGSSATLNVKEISDVSSFEVYIAFWNIRKMHEIPSYQNSDFYITWENESSGSSIDLKCCYRCYDSSYQDPNDLIEMTPPYAGDISIRDNQVLSCDRTVSTEYSIRQKQKSMWQYAGRYSEARDPITHENRPAVYDCVILYNGKGWGEKKNYYILNWIRFNLSENKWYMQAKRADKNVFEDYELNMSDFTNPICYIAYDFNKVVEGVDSAKSGIKINAFDYSAYITTIGATSHDAWFGSNSINARQSLKFQSYTPKSSYDGGCTEEWNKYHDNDSADHIYRGIVKNKLNSNGFPELKNKQISDYNTKLNYLFDNSKSNWKNNYTNLTGLFDKNVLENAGYYCFGSSDVWEPTVSKKLCSGHFAQLRKRPDTNYSSMKDAESHSARNNFVLFDEMNLCTNGYGDSQRYFMPFDDFSSEAHNNNYHFGMTIESGFMQPEDGIANPAKEWAGPMTFHFNGDDDMWVFCDGILMLDLGGVHGKNRGDINFSTGEINVYKAGDNSTIEKTYYMDDEFLEAEGKERDYFKTRGSGWEPVLDDAGNPVMHKDPNTGADVPTYRYADFTTHSFKMFYLERGGGASNCEIAFNLAALPEGSVAVGKKVDSDSNIICGKNDNFNYKVQVKDFDYKSGLYGDWHDYNDGVHDAIYDVYDASNLNTPIRTEQYPENNIVTIRDNEIAVLHGYEPLDMFRIGEGDPFGNNEIESRWDVETAYSGSGSVDLEWQSAAIIGDYTPGKWYGVEDVIAGNDSKTTLLFFKNTSKTSDFKVTKEKSNGLETEVLISSKGSYPYDASYIDPSIYIGDYDLILANGIIESNKHTDDGKIKFNDGDTIVIHNIQPGIKMNVIDLSENRGPTFGIDECDYSSAVWKAGQMSNSYPSVSTGVEYDNKKWVSTDFFSAKIPLMPASASTSDRYGQVYLRENTNLTIGKIVNVNGFSFSEKYDTYSVGAKLFNNTNIYDSSSEYNAVLRHDSTETDMIAKIDNGIIKVKNGTDWELPKLKDQDTIEIYSILPNIATNNRVTALKAVETNLNKSDWAPTSKTDSGTEIDMTDKDSGLVLSNDFALIDAGLSHEVIVKNNFNEIPTGFMLGPNWLWLLVIVIMVTLGGAFAYKLRQSNKASAINKDFINETINHEDIQYDFKLDSLFETSYVDTTKWPSNPKEAKESVLSSIESCSELLKNQNNK